MKFLNKQEQVIDLELTQYGKYLLSKGRFDPEFYAFFDNDVLYDSQYGNVSEPQNSAQDRIKTVPQLEAQYVFHGIETEIVRNNNFVRQGEVSSEGDYKLLGALKVQPTPDRHYALSAPIGTISLEATTAPGWVLNVLQGKITGTVYYQSGEQPTLRIPQLTMKQIEFKTNVVSSELPNDGKEVNVTSDLGLVARKFADGSFVNIQEDSLIIELDEANTLFENENFDVEVFESKIITGSNGITQEKLIPLFFIQQKSLVQDHILLDPSEVKVDLPTLDPTYVDYFFNVLVDDEIDPELLCELAPANKADGLFSNRVLDCENIVRKKIIDQKLYTSNVTEEDIKDKC